MASSEGQGEWISPLDAEIRAKQAAKSAALGDTDGKLRAWIEAVLEQPLPEGGLVQACRNGVVLCNFVNRLAELCEPPLPKPVKKVSSSSVAFKAMENLSNFVNACKQLGVPASGCFDTLDVFEKGDVVGLTQTLQLLAGAVVEPGVNYQGPQLESELTAAGRARTSSSAQHERTSSGSDAQVPSMFRRKAPSVGSAEALNELQPQAHAHLGVAVPDEVLAESAATVVVSHKAADGKGLSVTAGAVVFVMYLQGEGDGAVAMVQLGKESGLVPLTCLRGGAPDDALEAADQMGRGGGHGLDRAIALRDAARYDKLHEAKAQLWLERLLGDKCEARGSKYAFFDYLRDGTRLCRLANVIQPGSVPSFHEQPSGVSQKFQEMENISHFLEAARGIGVRKGDLFETVDLHELKSRSLVLQALYAVSTAALKSTEFPGPFLSEKGTTAAQALNILMREELSKADSRQVQFASSARQLLSSDATSVDVAPAAETVDLEIEPSVDAPPQDAPVEPAPTGEEPPVLVIEPDQPPAAEAEVAPAAEEDAMAFMHALAGSGPQFSIDDAHLTCARLPDAIPKWSSTDFSIDMRALLGGMAQSTKIGSGNFGAVSVVDYKGTPRAVKVQPIPNVFGDEEWAQEILDNLVCELSVLRSACMGPDTPHMVNFVGAGRAGNDVYFVMELAPNGDLRQCLEGDQCPDWQTLVAILRDSVAGLEHLHGLGMMHRDFKTPNILIDGNMRGVLCDFGFCIWADSPARLETCAGTEEFMAPEMELGDDFDLSADMFSVGITICEVATRRRPGEHRFLYRSPRNLYAFEPEIPKVYEALAGGCPLQLVEIAQGCCLFEGYDRATASFVKDQLGAVLLTM